MIVFYFFQKIVKFFVRLIFGERDTNEANATMATIGLIILIFLCSFGFVMSECEAWRDNRNEQKIESNINAATTNNQVLEANKQIQNAEVRTAEINSNQAVENKRAIDNKDSSEFDGKRAGKSFCEKFPRDSSCVQK